MRLVKAFVPPEVLAWRKRIGADRRDEMWDGVLHMAPAPNRAHQDLEGELEAYLRYEWKPRSGGKVYHQINVATPGRWPEDFRVPDLVLLLPDRFGIDRNEYFEGGPNVVVEIRSPGDETYEKLPFYAGLDVREVWIVERDVREVEVRRLLDGVYASVVPSADGWISSVETALELRARDGVLELRRSGEAGPAVRIGERSRP
ncbi:MAG: Uma2 family endonuclease [Planctomycetes bacterium]|nr:Uma2 family endonuclease [Planctomycetota bacterium]